MNIKTLFGILTSALALSAQGQGQLFSLDNGTPNQFGGEPGGDILALNHFNTGGSTDLITEIGVLWNPISASVHPTVALYSDPNGDGNPSDMEPLLIQPINTQSGVVVLNNSTVQWYSISPTEVTGSFFVGAFLSGGSSVIGVNTPGLGFGQSWVVENSTAGRMNLQNPIGTASDWENLDTFLTGNHMIEAVYTTVPEPSCTCLIALGSLCFIARKLSRSLFQPIRGGL